MTNKLYQILKYLIKILNKNIYQFAFLCYIFVYSDYYYLSIGKNVTLMLQQKKCWQYWSLIYFFSI